MTNRVKMCLSLLLLSGARRPDTAEGMHALQSEILAGAHGAMSRSI